jgi:hypothetical protein
MPRLRPLPRAAGVNFKPDEMAASQQRHQPMPGLVNVGYEQPERVQQRVQLRHVPQDEHDDHSSGDNEQVTAAADTDIFNHDAPLKNL